MENLKIMMSVACMSVIMFNSEELVEASNESESSLDTVVIETETVEASDPGDILYEDADITIIKGSEEPIAENGVSAFGAGEWDLVHSQYVYGGSQIVNSYGGDFKILISQPLVAGRPSWGYQVWEDDGSGTTNDDLIRSFTLPQDEYGYEVILHSEDHLDGDNNQAEYYLKKTNNTDIGVPCYFYD